MTIGTSSGSLVESREGGPLKAGSEKEGTGRALYNPGCLVLGPMPGTQVMTYYKAHLAAAKLNLNIFLSTHILAFKSKITQAEKVGQGYFMIV